ncbi:MAG: hypothetical protein UDV71_04195, partial [Collinsella sp.]|nr:hypothetical protein [Collinsella sp.]
RGYETEPKASMTCRGRTGTGSTAGPADRLQAVGGAIVALDSGLGHMSESRQSEQGALKRDGIDLLVMPPKPKGRLPLWRVYSVNWLRGLVKPRN